MIRRFLAVTIFPLLALYSSASAAAPDEKLSPAATQWWADISFIASDANEGRQTGSAGYMRAADYVISRMKAQGLQPAGDNGASTGGTCSSTIVHSAGRPSPVTRL